LECRGYLSKTIIPEAQEHFLVYPPCRQGNRVLIRNGATA
jgi:hypothetical protein